MFEILWGFVQEGEFGGGVELGELGQEQGVVGEGFGLAGREQGAFAGRRVAEVGRVAELGEIGGGLAADGLAVGVGVAGFVYHLG